jgi:hypothetical protein
VDVDETADGSAEDDADPAGRLRDPDASALELDPEPTPGAGGPARGGKSAATELDGAGGRSGVLVGKRVGRAPSSGAGGKSTSPAVGAFGADEDAAGVGLSILSRSIYRWFGIYMVWDRVAINN